MVDTVPSGTGYVDIKVGSYMAVAIDGNRALQLFGTNSSGVVGAPIPAGEYVAADIGAFHAAGVLSDGRLVSWGGASASTYGLVQDFADGPYVSVAAGERLGLGLRADGSLRSYGASVTAADIPTGPADYFAVAVSPKDSAFAIRRVVQ